MVAKLSNETLRERVRLRELNVFGSLLDCPSVSLVANVAETRSRGHVSLELSRGRPKRFDGDSIAHVQ